MVRYAFDISSNAWLEIQWYLFAAMVLLGASHTLRLNEHVRVDILYTQPLRARQGVARPLGTLVFLLPSMLLIAWFAWPFFMQSWSIQEMSMNAGGLIRWPVKILLPSASCWSRCRASPRSSSARPRCAATSATRPTTKGRCNDPARVDAAADVRRADR